MIAKPKRAPLRKVWQHEALGSTTWLEENLDVLNDAQDIRPSRAEREQLPRAIFFVGEGFDE